MWFLEHGESGLHLGGGLRYEVLVGDGAVWVFDGCRRMTQADGSAVTVEGTDGATVVVVTAPEGVALGPHRLGRVAKLPSAILAELSEAGACVLRGVADEGRVSRMRRAVAARREAEGGARTDGYHWDQGWLATDGDFVAAATHPVVLWVVEKYLGEPLAHVRCLHTPIANTLLPALDLVGAKFGGQMWHCDYPYHESFTNKWPERPVSLQCNLCVDDFRADNGATLYVPASHRENRWPTELNAGVKTGSDDAVHAGKRHFLAPAGSAVLYDSRTWHRRPDELNVSGATRVNVLLAFSHKWMRPMIPLRDEVAEFRANADLLAALPGRVRDAAALLFSGPEDASDEGDDDDVSIEEVDLGASSSDDEGGSSF